MKEAMNVFGRVAKGVFGKGTGTAKRRPDRQAELRYICKMLNTGLFWQLRMSLKMIPPWKACCTKYPMHGMLKIGAMPCPSSGTCCRTTHL